MAVITDLERLAQETRASQISYLRLIELGVAEPDPERGAVFFLVALERKPGHGEAVRNLDYLVEQGTDVARLKENLGLSSVKYPITEEASRSSGPDHAPTVSEEDVREAEAWYQKAFDAIYSGFDLEREYYEKALEHDPNMRRAWHELRNAAKEAGRYDLAERCDEAESILDAGGSIPSYRDILPSAR